MYPQNSDPNQNSLPNPSSAPSPIPDSSPAQVPNFNSQPPVQPTPPSQPKRKGPSKALLIAALVIVAAAAAGTYLYTKHNKDASKDVNIDVSVNDSNQASTTVCIPIITDSPDTSSLQTTFERFAKAVAAKNQSCVNSLSSTNYLALVKQVYTSSNGHWITEKVLGKESAADDFSQLPSSFDANKFTSASYPGQTIAGSAATPLTGTTLSYPIDLSKYSGSSAQKDQLSISLVVENGNLVVDDTSIAPAQ